MPFAPAITTPSPVSFAAPNRFKTKFAMRRCGGNIPSSLQGGDKEPIMVMAPVDSCCRRTCESTCAAIASPWEHRSCRAECPADHRACRLPCSAKAQIHNQSPPNELRHKRSAGVGSVDRQPRQSVDGARGDGQPDLAASFRPWDRGDERQLRHARPAAFTSPVARLARCARLHRERLERQSDAAN